MRRYLSFSSIAALALAAAACGGSDSSSSSSAPVATATPAPAASLPPSMFGPLYGAPAPTEDVSNEIDDISRDLRAVGERAPGGARDLASDLASLTPDPPDAAGLDAFSQSIVGAVEGKQMEPPKARRLAELLYSSLYTLDLTEQERTGVRGELAGLLKEIGAAPARVTAVEGAFVKMAPTAAR